MTAKAQPGSVSAKWINDNLTEENLSGDLVLRTSATLSGDITIPIEENNAIGVDGVYYDYGSTPVTTLAYTELVSSLSAKAFEVEVFDSSGQVLILAFGAMGDEEDQIFITPGGNGRIRFTVPSSTRVSVKAVSADATAGLLVINFYSA